MIKTYCFDGQPHCFQILETLFGPGHNVHYSGPYFTIGYIFYCQKCLLKIEVLKNDSQ